MARYMYLLVAFLMISTVAFGQTVQGKVIDSANGEGLPFANVVLEKDGVQKAGTTTDLDGNYILTGFDPGTYDILVIYVGYSDLRTEGIVVGGSKTVGFDIEMSVPSDGVKLDEIVVKAYKVPLIEMDNTASGATVTAEEIARMPVKSIGSLIATTAGVSRKKEGEETSFRGAREGDDIIFVDGVRTRRSTVPAADIEQIQVITSGLPAKYGDVTGGVTNIITKGPSSKFGGNIELETSEVLDPYGFNFLNLGVSGPLLSKKDADGEVLRSILGYRLSAQVTHLDDPNPSYVGAYRATDEFIDLLKTDPLVPVQTTDGLRYVPRGNFITEDDFERTKTRPNVGRLTINGSGKIDFQPIREINFTVGGNYNFIKRKQDLRTERTWLLNSDSNLDRFDKDWRVFVRLRHKIGGSDDNLTDEEKKEKSSATIQNINYSLQFDYNRVNIDRYDPNHKDNLFNYGYYGKYDIDFQRNYIEGDDGIFREGAATEVLTNFTPGGYNPYQELYLGYDGAVGNNISSSLIQNGFIPGNLEYVYAENLHYNYGTTQDFFQKIEENQYGVNATGGFDIVGKKDASEERSKHSIEFGVLYEQRIDRNYSIQPQSLWQVGRQMVRGDYYLDTSDSLMIGDSVSYSINYFENSTFVNNIRDKFSIPDNQQLNLDALSPEDLSMDLFSADELNSVLPALVLSYKGYDYTGKKLGADVTFNDFFTKKDGNGDLYRPVAPTTPIYTAFYLQDKFTYKDFIFNIGLRVDRFDANTQVLADPYTFNPIRTVSESSDLPHAANAEPDWKVYVESTGGTTVPSAYRDGDQWYTRTGAVVNDPLALFGSRAIGQTAHYERYQDIKDLDYNPEGVFVDYEPQINVLPRIAFSFPISKDAGFFAHYDILTRRPSERNDMTALDYYNWQDAQNLFANGLENPDLKPSKTIDYEVGFKQKISASSAVTLTAYYREQRDMISKRTYSYADPVPEYQTFGNRDFGTVKGFTFQYDLRRTKNFKLKIDYTLQFAEGTGSSGESSLRGTSALGTTRPIFPFDFDQRHNLIARMDYRFGENDQYNGPRIAGKNILENFGLNLLMSLGSGRPYTRKADPQPRGGRNTIGDFNGARYPWTTQFDLRVDKDFTFGGKGGKKARTVNVFLRVLNLLNTRNVVGFYPFTQDPDSDGYLITPGSGGQDDIDAAESATSYETLYNLRLLNDAYFGLPRRIRLGLQANF